MEADQDGEDEAWDFYLVSQIALQEGEMETY